MNIKPYYLIQLPKKEDKRGNLTHLQNLQEIPFEIERVFWTYDIPGGSIRGGHAYKTQKEIIIALSGSFDIIVTELNGEKIRFHLNRSYFGLYLPPTTWRHLENSSTNSLALHLSSKKFDDFDYIRSFEELRSFTENDGKL